jgi:hypothetical protein
MAELVELAVNYLRISSDHSMTGVLNRGRVDRARSART